MADSMKLAMAGAESGLLSKNDLVNRRKVCIMNLRAEDTDDYVLSACEIFGTVIELRRAEENLAFATFSSEW